MWHECIHCVADARMRWGGGDHFPTLTLKQYREIFNPSALPIHSIHCFPQISLFIPLFCFLFLQTKPGKYAHMQHCNVLTRAASDRNDGI